MVAGVGVSKEVEDEAMRLYVQEGLSHADVAKRVGMSESWVSTLRNKRGISCRPKGKPLDHRLIIRLYVDEGLTLRELAAHQRVDSTRIRKLLVDHGVRIVSIGERSTRIDVDQVRQLYVNDRLTIPQVAKKLKLSPSGVRNAMNRHGIPTRTAIPLNVSRSALEGHLGDGLSNEEIAKLYGVNTWRVTKLKRDHGLRRPNAAPVHEAPPAAELKQKYLAEQQSIIAISEHYGTTHSTVRAWLQKAGVSIGDDRPGTANRRDTDLTAKELHSLYVTQELTAADIAAQIGVTKKIVLVMLHGYGIPLRPPGGPRPGHPLPLLDRLYQDTTICETLRRHDVPLATNYGLQRERFSQPPSLTPELLDKLYHGCGLSTMMMSLLVGHGEASIRRKMRDASIATRGGGRSPWAQTND